MNDKDATPKPSPQIPDPISALRPLAPAAWMSTAWIESLASLGSEITSFVAERIRQDVMTQHSILHSKSLSELQHVQAEFMQRALDQYAAETGKLVEMSSEIGDMIKSSTDTNS